MEDSVWEVLIKVNMTWILYHTKGNCNNGVDAE